MWTWSIAIEANRTALVRVLAALFSTVGLVPGGSVSTLPRHRYNQVMRLLRSAESATRRLIVIYSRKVAKKVPLVARPARPCPKIPRRDTKRVPAFALFDTWKRFDETPRCQGPGPRVTMFDDDLVPLVVKRQRAALALQYAQQARSPLPDDPVSAVRLCHRLQAIQRALEDIPAQVKRLARAMAPRSLVPLVPRRVPPMRPGYPPGHRTRHIHEVDTILDNCHGLALQTFAPP